MCFLSMRICPQDPARHLDSGFPIAASFVEICQPKEQLQKGPSQLLSALLGPRFVAVLVRGPRRRVRWLPGRLLGLGSGGLIPPPLRKHLRPPTGSLSDTARATHLRMQGSGTLQPGRGSCGWRGGSDAGCWKRPLPEVRPEQVHDLLAVHAMPRGEGEQLDQGRSLLARYLLL